MEEHWESSEIITEFIKVVKDWLGLYGAHLDGPDATELILMTLIDTADMFQECLNHHHQLSRLQRDYQHSGMAHLQRRSMSSIREFVQEVRGRLVPYVKLIYKARGFDLIRLTMVEAAEMFLDARSVIKLQLARLQTGPQQTIMMYRAAELDCQQTRTSVISTLVKEVESRLVLYDQHIHSPVNPELIWQKIAEVSAMLENSQMLQRPNLPMDLMPGCKEDASIRETTQPQLVNPLEEDCLLSLCESTAPTNTIQECWTADPQQCAPSQGSVQELEKLNLSWPTIDYIVAEETAALSTVLPGCRAVDPDPQLEETEQLSAYSGEPLAMGESTAELCLQYATPENGEMKDWGGGGLEACGQQQVIFQGDTLIVMASGEQMEILGDGSSDTPIKGQLKVQEVVPVGKPPQQQGLTSDFMALKHQDNSARLPGAGEMSPCSAATTVTPVWLPREYKEGETGRPDRRRGSRRRNKERRRHEKRKHEGFDASEWTLDEIHTKVPETGVSDQQVMTHKLREKRNTDTKRSQRKFAVPRWRSSRCPGCFSILALLDNPDVAVDQPNPYVKESPVAEEFDVIPEKPTPDYENN